MSNSQFSNENTDRTVDEQVNDQVDEQVDKQVNDQVNDNEQSRTSYEVVFFAKYNKNPRPTLEQMTQFFDKYGTVHHINYPMDRNYAFIFMSKLSTDVEHRRTRTTIGQIIHDMTPETQFHVTVASSNRRPNATYTRRNIGPRREYSNMHRNFSNNGPIKYNSYKRNNLYDNNSHNRNNSYDNRYNSYDKYDNNSYNSMKNQSFEPRRMQFPDRKPRYQNRGSYTRPMSDIEMNQQ